MKSPATKLDGLPDLPDATAVMQAAVASGMYLEGPFVVRHFQTAEHSGEDLQFIQLPTDARFTYALELLSCQTPKLYICRSCEYQESGETIRALAIAQFESGHLSDGWVADVVGYGKDATLCAWQRNSEFVISMFRKMFQDKKKESKMTLEKTGTPTALAKQVEFDLSKPDEVQQLQVTIRNGKPSSIVALGTDQADKAALAKLLRQAANQLNAD